MKKLQKVIFLIFQRRERGVRRDKSENNCFPLRSL